MKILDIEGNELQEDSLDFEKGYLEGEDVFVKHHDEIPEQEREFHYKVVAFRFEDGTSLIIENEDDPHIEKIDIYKGIFRYKSLEGEEEKVASNIEIEEVEDKPYIPGKKAWDEYEEIGRYHLYTQEELDWKKQERERWERTKEFMETGLNRIEQSEENIQETSSTVDDLVLVMADLFGGEEEE